MNLAQENRRRCDYWLQGLEMRGENRNIPKKHAKVWVQNVV